MLWFNLCILLNVGPHQPTPYERRNAAAALQQFTFMVAQRLSVCKAVLVSTGNPVFVIVPQYGSSKITVFVWGKNIILKFLGNTK